ncbi:MAG: threonine/serine exporter family protein [Planctomycetota bacterium]
MPVPTRAARFVMRFGLALARFGTPADRLEETLTRTAARLGLRGRFLAVPTALHASFDRDTSDRGDRDEGHGPPLTLFERCEPSGEIDLGRLADLDGLSSALAQGPLDLDAANRELDAILAAPRRWPAWATVLAFAVASAGAAVFFGGSPADLGTAGVIGAALAFLMPWLTRSARIAPLAGVVSAWFATFTAVAAGVLAERYGIAHTPLVATLAGLIVLLPGLSLTMAVRELSAGHLASGTARLAGVMVTFFSLAIGFAIGERSAAAMWAQPTPLPAEALSALATPFWCVAVAGAVSPLAFAVLFAARRRDVPTILIACLISFWGARLGSATLGPELGALLGTACLGMVANVYARLCDQPAAVPMVPALLMLVPGSLGFRSLSALIADDVVGGLQTAFAMALVAMALVIGLLLANAAVPPRDAF